LSVGSDNRKKYSMCHACHKGKKLLRQVREWPCSEETKTCCASASTFDGDPAMRGALGSRARPLMTLEERCGGSPKQKEIRERSTV